MKKTIFEEMGGTYIRHTVMGEEWNCLELEMKL